MSKRTMGILSECIPMFTMLQDENRQQILVLLFDHKQMTVNEITEKLELSRPAVSHHLKLLLDAGLLSVKKNGKERIYSLDLQKAMAQLKELLLSIEADINA
ncbi:metalloregulator ArsR/SmtB family transcription factor [Bacilliculturomica massiliensis]|uniref:metalloregulator ArsR/SmtB family transcription factor n=1 Tax=Bacilliculturomica massiliensis TaxID=1917867 RepID=UPI0010326D63|nr:metalloregulator ArsR/SmtB family transcription factor [Bacilliculturomica massiliensis]